MLDLQRTIGISCSKRDSNGFEICTAGHDNKGFEICTAGLEFESGRAPLVKAWDSRGFTSSPELTKYVF
jgi:hypothetical protein